MDRKSIPETEHGLSKEADEFCEGYKAFLTNKTEREVIDYVLPILADRGYKEYVRGAKLKAGAKFYKVNRGKTILMCTKGKRPVSEGVRVSVAHIDSPRLDFKPHPLFEDASMAFFKTHYYGGIKKYQWTTIPLSIRGVVYTKSGEKVTVKIGEGHDEPAFLITDLLPHLAQNQMKKGASEIVEGEQLNLLIGSIPYDDEKVKDRVKLAIMKILNDRYGITEDDFETAELCAVPAFHPRDMGLDRSMIAAYGQDDSSCAYAEFMAEIDTKNPEYTTVTIFADTGIPGTFGVDVIQLVLHGFLHAHHIGSLLPEHLRRGVTTVRPTVVAVAPPTGTHIERNQFDRYCILTGLDRVRETERKQQKKHCLFHRNIYWFVA